MTTTDIPSRLGRLFSRFASLPARQRWTLLVLTVGVILLLLSSAAVALTYFQVQRNATIPTAESLAQPDPTVLRDHSGERVETFEPAELRRNISIDDLPAHVPDAVLAAEDRRFYEHGGFSPRAILRAARANLTAGEVEEGASTIHQQYVAMAVADIDDSYWGKFREVAIASRLDAEMSKDEVLEMYLNQVPFGRTARGLEAAARTYFNVSASELDVEQAAILAGLIAAPSAFDPESNPEGAMSRRDFVLEGMVEMGTLERREADELIGSDLPELRDEPILTFGPNTYFLETVRDRVPELLDDEDVNVAEGLDIYTTLDPRAQELAIETLNTHLGDIDPSGAVTTIDSNSGGVRALVGGLDFESEQVNAAVDAQRQIGSAYKTFGLVELVDQGYDPDATMIHAPEEYEVEQEGAEDTTVGNYSGRSHGEISARQATVNSVNTAYMQLSEELGIEQIAATAQRLGIETELDEFPVSILGTDDLRPLEVTAAYATLSAEGTYTQPHLVERIETHDGEVLYEHEPDPTEVIDPNTAHVVSDVLQDVVTRGTATAAAIGRPVAGKTGTTNDYRDAWFVGYTPSHTTGIWVGNRDNSPMDDISGGTLPAPIFSDYMSELLEGTDVEEFPTPDTSELRALTTVDAPEPEDDGEDDLFDSGTSTDESTETEDSEDTEDDEEESEDAEQNGDDEQSEDDEQNEDSEQSEDSDESEGSEDDGVDEEIPEIPEEDEGNTDDANSDDGSTDDSTDDGSTDDGSTDDGSSDDGSTDDSTDDSSTDDGSTDDGSTDDSSTDDGSTDDSNADDGSTSENTS